MPIRALVTPRRLDLAVKHRLFRHLLRGDDHDAIRIYLWHIEQRSGARMKVGLATDRWKRSLDDYLGSARGLLASMAANGFLAEHPVPVDPDGELLDASHRVGCALALGIETVPVKRETRRAWAPAWDEAWFVSHGMAPCDLSRLREDYAALSKDDG